MPVRHLLEQILNEYIEAAGLQSGQPLFRSNREPGWNGSDGTCFEPLQRLGRDSEAGQGGRLSHPRWMSHLAGNRYHHLPGERRTPGARPADGGTRIPANNQTLRPNKGRDYTKRGRTHPVVKFVSDRHCGFFQREIVDHLNSLQRATHSLKSESSSQQLTECGADPLIPEELGSCRGRDVAICHMPATSASSIGRQVKQECPCQASRYPTVPQGLQTYCEAFTAARLPTEATSVRPWGAPA